MYRDWRGRNCKVQVLVLWELDNFRTPGARIADISGFWKLEAQFSYSVLIHKPGFQFHPGLFIWSPGNVPGEGVKPSFRSLPQLYLAVLLHVETPSPTNSPSTPGVSLKGVTLQYDLVDLVRLCLYCTLDSAYPYQAQGPLGLLSTLLSDSGAKGSIAAHEKALRPMNMNSWVVIRGLVPDLGLFESELSGARWLKFYTGIQQLVDSYGPKSIVTLKYQTFFPEELLFAEIMKLYPNVTFDFKIGDSRSSHNKFNYYNEMIIGPGLPFNNVVAGTRTIVGHNSVTFVTCSNISLVPVTGVFFKPLDTGTWLAVLGSTVVTSLFLLVIVKPKSLLSWLRVCEMLWKLLLEDFEDLSESLKCNPTMFAFITLVFALATVVVTNGYKGILTADMVLAPSILGPRNFHELLSNDWDFYSVQEPRLLNVYRFSASSTYFIINRIAMGPAFRVSTVANSLSVFRTNVISNSSSSVQLDKELNLVQDILHAVELTQVKLRRGYKNSLWNNCSCHKNAMLVFKGDLSTIRLPIECLEAKREKVFMLGEEEVAKAQLAWLSAGWRPGLVFNALENLVQSGIHQWLAKVLQGSTKMEVDGDLLQALQPGHDRVVNEPVVELEVPLHLRNLIVSSTFELLWVLDVVAIGFFVMEVVLNWMKGILN